MAPGRRRRPRRRTSPGRAEAAPLLRTVVTLALRDETNSVKLCCCGVLWITHHHEIALSLHLGPAGRIGKVRESNELSTTRRSGDGRRRRPPRHNRSRAFSY